MSRIPVKDTAFRDSRRRFRTPRRRTDSHLDFIRQLPCIICFTPFTEACHIRYADPRFGKRYTGKGEKPDDMWTVPMCRHHHSEQHGMNERAFWSLHQIDATRVAAALFIQTGNNEICENEILKFSRVG